MKTKKLFPALFCAATLVTVFALCFAGCTKPEDDNNGDDNGNDVKVTVVTYEPQEITAISAVCGGEVSVSNDAARVEVGVCWNTSGTPTVNDNNLIAETGKLSFTVTVKGLEPNTDYWVRAYAKVSADYYYGEAIRFTTGDNRWVDLGLPSGLLWARFNVGATLPEEYGDYFGWAETSPNPPYTWPTYKYGGSDLWHITKYCCDSLHGGVCDGLTTILPEDDAATVNWGPDCHTPTAMEWNELLDYTTNTWTTINGINGRIFTGSNGNSIFLPCGGKYSGNDVPHVNDQADYWSSTLNSQQPNHAKLLHFIKASLYMLDNGSRPAGYSIRPVKSRS